MNSFTYHSVLKAIMANKMTEEGQIPHPIKSRFMNGSEKGAFITQMKDLFCINNQDSILRSFYIDPEALETAYYAKARQIYQGCFERMEKGEQVAKTRAANGEKEKIH